MVAKNAEADRKSWSKVHQGFNREKEILMKFYSKTESQKKFMVCPVSDFNRKFFNYVPMIPNLGFSKSFRRISFACSFNPYFILRHTVCSTVSGIKFLLETSRKILEILKSSEFILKCSKDSSRLAELMHLVFYIWSSLTDQQTSLTFGHIDRICYFGPKSLALSTFYHTSAAITQIGPRSTVHNFIDRQSDKSSSPAAW